MRKPLPAMLRTADFIQVLKELVEPFQRNVHLQQMICGKSSDSNPTFGNIDPFMLPLSSPDVRRA